MARPFAPTAYTPSHGRYKRSTKAKNQFKRLHPCPSTGSPNGRCPGYVIDHVTPLECRRADAPFKMQWQTIPTERPKIHGSEIVGVVRPRVVCQPPHRNGYRKNGETAHVHLLDLGSSRTLWPSIGHQK
jgi:hypothetical protein